MTSPSTFTSPRCFRGSFSAAGDAALSTTLAAFAIAYLLRPLGGFVFGHIGDRFGRRRTMLLSVALMTMTMLGTALLPTHAQVGAAAGWLLFLLRCVMGFSVGGEYIAVVAYLLEGAPHNKRGLITSLASAPARSGGCSRSASRADRQRDKLGKPELMGMAHPLSRRRGSGGERVDCPYDNAESPDFKRQQAGGTVPEARCCTRSPIIAPASCERSPSPPWVNHILCRDHLCSDIPDLRRKAG